MSNNTCCIVQQINKGSTDIFSFNTRKKDQDVCSFKNKKKAKEEL